MVKYCLLAGSAALWFAIGSYAAPPQVIYRGDLTPLNIVPGYDHGYVIAWDRNIDADMSLKRISVYAPTGSLAFQTDIQVAGHPRLDLLNGAVDTDGSVAVVFDGPRGFAVLDKNGKQIQTVLTGSYAPTQICFAPDHTIWLAGNSFGPQDHGILRRYSADGQLLGEFLPRSTYDLAAVRIVGGRAMRAASDRIVMLLQRATELSSASLEWLEIDLAGNVIGRPGRHRSFFPWVLTPDGTIYAKEGGGKLLVFDRAANLWRVAPVTPPTNGHLEGADEKGLVYRDSIAYSWVPTK